MGGQDPGVAARDRGLHNPHQARGVLHGKGRILPIAYTHPQGEVPRNALLRRREYDQLR